VAQVASLAAVVVVAGTAVVDTAEDLAAVAAAVDAAIGEAAATAADVAGSSHIPNRRDCIPYRRPWAARRVFVNTKGLPPVVFQ
jgi:hypothetical protein